jgi:hypothetical protein
MPHRRWDCNPGPPYRFDSRLTCKAQHIHDALVPKPPTITPAGSVQITIRIDPDLIPRADALLRYVTGQHGLPAARSDVWREALRRGLRELELEKKKSKDR